MRLLIKIVVVVVLAGLAIQFIVIPVLDKVA